jgi:hypothetical protein
MRYYSSAERGPGIPLFGDVHYHRPRSSSDHSRKNLDLDSANIGRTLPERGNEANIVAPHNSSAEGWAIREVKFEGGRSRAKFGAGCSTICTSGDELSPAKFRLVKRNSYLTRVSLPGGDLFPGKILLAFHLNRARNAVYQLLGCYLRERRPRLIR